MVAYIIMALIAYLIGSINFSIIISKKIAGFDVREKGSGNAGTTNVLRAVGVKAAIITLICDILKGVVSISIARLMGNIFENVNTDILIQLAGIFVIVGHTFPIFFEFKGGKGVATSLGVILTSNWKIGLICLVFGIVIIALSKMVSMGSIGAAILFPILIIFLDGTTYFIYGVLLAVFVIFNHRENIKRILDGTENKISFKKQ